MIIKFSCFLEFHPCMSTYCIRHCLKIANTHIQFAVTEGFLSRSKTSQQYTRWKIRWTSLPGSSVFHPFFLEGKIYESIFIQSVGLLCEMCLYQQKQVQRHTRCFGNRKWEGVLKFFVHVWFCLLVSDGSSSSLPPNHTNFCGDWSHWTTWTESSPQALADLVDNLGSGC